MEPGVTVRGRAGNSEALPRSCIYRCRISRRLKIRALDPFPESEGCQSVGASLSADVPLTPRLEHVFVFVKRCLRFGSYLSLRIMSVRMVDSGRSARVL